MLTYTKTNFSKYNYIYNIILYKASILFFLSKSMVYVYLFWLIWDVKKHFLKYKYPVFNCLDFFYKKPIYFFLNQLKINMKPYSNHKKTCMFFAKSIIDLNIFVKNYTSRSTNVLKINKPKIILYKYEFLNFYKYRILNNLKFKNIFNFLLLMLPLYLLNFYESWTVTVGYNLFIMHTLFLIIPYLQKKYFFFNYYL